MARLPVVSLTPMAARGMIGLFKITHIVALSTPHGLIILIMDQGQIAVA